MIRRRTARLVPAVLAAVLALVACGTPGSSGSETTRDRPPRRTRPQGRQRESAAPATGEPIKVALITSLSGPLQSYGEMYVDAFNVGLDYATDGTGAVNGRPIEVATADDGGDPAKATTAATDYIGQGYQILAGSASSGVALQVAPLAAENKVLFVSGPAATDGLTGINKYTFRSGRQTYQDIQTAASFVGDLQGKKVTVFAQDSAFGQANVAAVTAVLGGEGATVTPVLVPATRHRSGHLRQAGRRHAGRPAVRRVGRHQRHPDVGLAEPAGRVRRGHHRGHRPRHQAHPRRFRPGRGQDRPARALLRRRHRQRGRAGPGRRTDQGGQDPGPVLAGRLHRRADDRARAGGLARRRRRDDHRARGLDVRRGQGLDDDPRRGSRAAAADVPGEAHRLGRRRRRRNWSRNSRPTRWRRR